MPLLLWNTSSLPGSLHPFKVSTAVREISVTYLDTSKNPMIITVGRLYNNYLDMTDSSILARLNTFSLKYTKYKLMVTGMGVDS